MFAWIVKNSLTQRLFVLILAVGLIIAGIGQLRTLSVDVLPDLNRPMVTLMVEANGMAPEEIEQRVIRPLEQNLNGLPDLKRMRTVSGIGLGILYLEFEWGTDVFRHRQQIAEKISVVREQLPVNVVPQMAPVSSIMGEIMLLALPIQKGQAMATREFADWVMRPQLLSIAGVAQVVPIGGEVRQYQVLPNPTQMRFLQVNLEQIQKALQDFGVNTSGGFLEQSGREYLIRQIGQTNRIDDLKNIVVTMRNDQPIFLHQVATVQFAPAIKRGEGSLNGEPAVILSIQKQPTANTLALTALLEEKIKQLNLQRSSEIGALQIVFRQADFIEKSINNIEEALRDGVIIVALVLLLFLFNIRVTVISLLAIPLSILMSILMFYFFGLTINTMTLGGIAIAIGELVDDAIVDIENILRRLSLNAQHEKPLPVLNVIYEASLEVRSGIVYATLIVACVFIPLFALPGMEGRLFTPLGWAYIISVLASMLISMTITPVLASYGLTSHKALTHRETAFLRFLKKQYVRLLHWHFAHHQVFFGSVIVLFIVAGSAVITLPRAFLPPFNEGSLTLGLFLQPGTALSESDRLGRAVEKLLLTLPEVEKVSRRTGRAELDEHAEGVHYSEIDIRLRASSRPRSEVVAAIREKLALLPVNFLLGQPISHRLDHLMSGVRAQVVLKIFGQDLNTQRLLAEQLKTKMQQIQGFVDIQIEKQVMVPQYQIVLDYAKLAQYGLSAGALLQQLEQLIQGQTLGQVFEQNKRFNIVLRLAEKERAAAYLKDLLIATPRGNIPLQQLAVILEKNGPNQINHENMVRRLILSANTDGHDLNAVIHPLQNLLAQFSLPEGYHIQLEGQYQAQQEATQRLLILGSLAIGFIFVILYSRYHSMKLALLIMLNIPLAFIGSFIALKISGQALSVASLIGLITLTGMTTRNGILKVSHYLNLVLREGEKWGKAMIIRGSLERLTPVLMTALTASLALLPLLFAGEQPGKEILHPVAVVIFGGLMSATLLDSFLTPVLFYKWIKETDIQRHTLVGY